MQVIEDYKRHLTWREIVVSNSGHLFSVVLHWGKLISITQVSPQIITIDSKSDLYKMVSNTVAEYIKEHKGKKSAEWVD